MHAKSIKLFRPEGATGPYQLEVEWSCGCTTFYSRPGSYESATQLHVSAADEHASMCTRGRKAG